MQWCGSTPSKTILRSTFNNIILTDSNIINPNPPNNITTDASKNIKTLEILPPLIVSPNISNWVNLTANLFTNKNRFLNLFLKNLKNMKRKLFISCLSREISTMKGLTNQNNSVFRMFLIGWSRLLPSQRWPKMLVIDPWSFSRRSVILTLRSFMEKRFFTTCVLLYQLESNLNVQAKTISKASSTSTITKYRSRTLFMPNSVFSRYICTN